MKYEVENKLLDVCASEGYVPVLASNRAQGRLKKGVVVENEKLGLKLVLHKDIGVDASGKLIKLNIAIAPQLFNERIIGSVVGVKQSINKKTGAGIFRHSIYKYISQSDNHQEPPAMRYEIDWNDGCSENILKIFLSEIKSQI